ncbi:MFS transporter [Paenibacillus hemerocallicola]|uniref:MFS transporter n=1 Tax=Paenibacillus hemerocallicola TaxID=1172614 RepID=A0A5C4T8Y5_9BACL|nr:MFS transporter [Paenibacillus hemerocallicola]TNJ64809.1 MFS transporter [Paenibacillus hemerocallicola]
MALQAWKVAPSSIKALYVCSFLMNLGFYALIPYLTLHLTGNFLWSLALTGVLLGVRQFSQQGFTFIGGIVADRFGCKETLVFGVGVRAVGFLAFAFCTDMWQFFAAAIVSGLGGALFEPSYQAAFARLTPEEHRKLLFSFKNIVSNLGMVSSTIVGSILSSLDFFYLSLVSGGIYIFIACLIAWKLPRLNVDFSRESVLKDMQTIFKDKPFVAYTLILIGYYYLFMQLFLTLPQLAETVAGNKNGVAYVYAAISISVILFQLRITRALQNYENRFMLIGLGTLVMGLGLFAFTFAYNLILLLAGSVVFAFGTMIAGPLLMDVVPMFAPPRQIASYYGFNGYSLAIGGALSTIVGGWFYDLGIHLGWPGLPWIVCLVVALTASWRLYRLKDNRNRFQSASLEKS